MELEEGIDGLAPAVAQGIRQLIKERDEARANARILAHSYTHDSRPPAAVVDASLAYPVDATAPKRVERRG